MTRIVMKIICVEKKIKVAIDYKYGTIEDKIKFIVFLVDSMSRYHFCGKNTFWKKLIDFSGMSTPLRSL